MRDAEKIEKSDQESTYRTLFENLNTGVYRNTGGPKGRFIKANPAIAVMFGYDSVEEFMKVAVADLYASPKDRDAFVREIQQRGSARNKELQLKKKDGTPIWGECTAMAKYDDRGNLLWIDGIIEDITSRKEAQKALARTNEVLNNILSASPVGIGLVENNTIQWANDELAQMFGFSSKRDFVGQNLAVLYPSEDEYKAVLASIKKMLKEGRPAQADATYKRKNGHTFVGHFKMSCPEPLNPSKRAIFTINDISWRKRAEAEKLRREKMQAVLETAGAICHELNQPLQIISGYADLLAMIREESKSPDQYIDSIRMQVKKLAQITHKLMHLTKYETKPYLDGQIVDIDKSSA